MRSGRALSASGRNASAPRLRSVLWVLAAAVVMLAFPGGLFAQMRVGGGGPAAPIEDTAKAAIIDSVAAALNRVYVFPDVAERMEKEMRHNLRSGAYKDIGTYQEFTGRLTEDLYGIGKDKHLHVLYSPEPDFRLTEEDSLSDEEIERMITRMKRDNFGFAKIEHLAGNVGYLDLRGFNEARWAGRTAIAAMSFLANSDAVIIDLRQNGGGSPSMIQLISSYFFDEPVHLNSFYIRDEDKTKQFWSQAYVDGPRMTDVDLYVLTSARTFSAAEEFTYNMKNLQRATIVGETTGGGAHPVRFVGFPDLKVSMSLPFGRAVNPITGTNWEGTGIEPHIAVPAAGALDVAHLEALKRLAEKAEDAEIKGSLDWDIMRLSARSDPVELDPGQGARYAGAYEPRRLTYEAGTLYYQRGDNPRIRAIPVGQDAFVFDEYDFFMLEVETDGEGNPTALVGHYRDGRTDRTPRTE